MEISVTNQFSTIFFQKKMGTAVMGGKEIELFWVFPRDGGMELPKGSEVMGMVRYADHPHFPEESDRNTVEGFELLRPAGGSRILEAGLHALQRALNIEAREWFDAPYGQGGPNRYSTIKSLMRTESRAGGRLYVFSFLEEDAARAIARAKIKVEGWKTLQVLQRKEFA